MPCSRCIPGSVSQWFIMRTAAITKSRSFVMLTTDERAHTCACAQKCVRTVHTTRPYAWRCIETWYEKASSHQLAFPASQSTAHCSCNTSVVLKVVDSLNRQRTFSGTPASSSVTRQLALCTQPGFLGHVLQRSLSISKALVHSISCSCAPCHRLQCSFLCTGS